MSRNSRRGLAFCIDPWYSLTLARRRHHSSSFSTCEQDLELLPPFPAVGGVQWRDRQWENKRLTLDLSYSLLVPKHTLDLSPINFLFLKRTLNLLIGSLGRVKHCQGPVLDSEEAKGHTMAHLREKGSSMS